MYVPFYDNSTLMADWTITYYRTQNKKYNTVRNELYYTHSQYIGGTNLQDNIKQPLCRTVTGTYIVCLENEIVIYI